MKVEKRLNEIKAGDYVLIGDSYLNDDNLIHTKVCVVEKVTPTGIIRIKDDNTKYNKYGEESCSDKYARYNIGRKWKNIYKLTEELNEKRNEQIREYKLIKQAQEIIKNLNMDKEKAEKIIELFGDSQ